nr:MAG TPA: hypothetical protein [Caudoviricetes sp.]
MFSIFQELFLIFRKHNIKCFEFPKIRKIRVDISEKSCLNMTCR